jgi:general secretion pathway protein G
MSLLSIFRSRSSRASRRGERGFTLVEILVVITIIGLIMALVAPRVLNYLGEAKVKAAKIQSEGLTALVQRPAGVEGWNGPYLKGGFVPADPWGHPYVYRMPGEHGTYDIMSYGPGGPEGGTATASNVTSWAH